MLSFKLIRRMYEALIVGNYIKLGYVTKAIDIVSCNYEWSKNVWCFTFLVLNDRNFAANFPQYVVSLYN